MAQGPLKGCEMNHLTHEKFYAACNALQSMKAEIEKTRPSREEVAAKLASQLKFKVTTANLDTMLRVTGITWRQRKEAKPKKQDTGSAEEHSNPDQRTTSIVLRIWNCSFGRFQTTARFDDGENEQ